MSDIISENDGELSPASNRKRRIQSPKRNKLKLPDLKLKVVNKHKKMQNVFKKHVSSVHGVVTVLNAISSSTKRKLNMNRSLIMRSKNENSVDSLNPSGSEFHTRLASISPNAGRNNQQVSPAWDRLSKPRFVSPTLNPIRSEADCPKSGELPSINQRSKNVSNLSKNHKRTRVENQKNLKKSLLVYQKSIKSLLKSPKCTSPRNRLLKKALVDKSFEIGSIYLNNSMNMEVPKPIKLSKGFHNIITKKAKEL